MAGCHEVRKRIQDAGWDCTGRDLLTVFTYMGTPVVIPSCLLRVAQHSAYGIPDDPQPFTGGQHYHLVIHALVDILKGPQVDQFKFIIGDEELAGLLRDQVGAERRDTQDEEPLHLPATELGSVAWPYWYGQRVTDIQLPDSEQ